MKKNKVDKVNFNTQLDAIDRSDSSDNLSVTTIQDTELISSVIVTALDPIYVEGGQLSYGFVVTLDDIDYSFRTNTQGYLQLNGSGIFTNNFTLSE